MHHFRKWPLASAVAAAVLLTGCLSGGGSSNSGGGSTAEPPVTDNPTDPNPTPTTTRYELTVEAPSAEQVTFRAKPSSNAEKVLAAVLDALISPAFAQVAQALAPEDFRVVILDDNGTPDDTSDDENDELTGGADFPVSQSNGVYAIDLPFEPTVSAYVAVQPGYGKELRVSLYKQESLVASPVSTFITRAIVNRGSEIDQLTPAELDDLIDEIVLLAQDPETQQAINNAYLSDGDTEDMLAEIESKLSVAVSDALDRRTAPPATEQARSEVTGDYHFQGLSIGVYSSVEGGGVLIGGTSNDARLEAINDTQVSFSSAAGSSLEYEGVYDLSGFLGVNAAISEEPDQGTMLLDSRGLTVPASEEVGAYDIEDDSVAACQENGAACTDRDFESANRLTAAGTGSPYATLVGSAYDDRLVTNADGEQQLKVLGGYLDIGVKKPVGIPSVVGDYGVLQIETQTAQAVDPFVNFRTALLDLALEDDNEAESCVRRERRMFVLLSTLQSSAPIFVNDDCSVLNTEDVTVQTYSVGDAGFVKLENPSNPNISREGYVSEDGLTLLLADQEPGRDDLEVASASELRNEPTGTRSLWYGVKRDKTLTSLAGRQYRLVSVALSSLINGTAEVNYRTIEMNRYLTGTLEFDAEGKGTMNLATQAQAARIGDLGQSYNNLQLTYNFDATNTTLTEGRLAMRSTTQVEGTDVTAELRAEGYVQEGGKLLILQREVLYPYSIIEGPLVAICTNCD